MANGAEYSRMLHVVSQYAVFHTSVGFSIRRIGRRPDLQTAAGASQLELIRRVTAWQRSTVLYPLLCSIAHLWLCSKVFGASVRSAMAPIHTWHGNQSWLERPRVAQVPQDAQVYVARVGGSLRSVSSMANMLLAPGRG